MKLTRAALVDLRARSLRKRVWFKELTAIERTLMNLTIRVVDEVKSSRLKRLLEHIVHKLEKALESSFLMRAGKKGRELAEKLARAAYSWGNIKAFAWAEDESYALFLGISNINAAKMFGCLS